MAAPIRTTGGANTPGPKRASDKAAAGKGGRIGKMSGWLPLVAAFLCLSLLAIAVITLFDVNAEPQSPPAAVATSVAAEGFQGLRRMLQARGHETTINRYEDGVATERGDVEIITLDNGMGVFSSDNPIHRAMKSRASVSSSASESAASQEASASGASADADADDEDTDESLPDPRRAQHILYQPLGRVVLVVAPKWYDEPYPAHPRWGMAPHLGDAESIGKILSVLAPVTARPSLVTPGSNNSVTFDRVAYQIARGGAGALTTLHAVSGQTLFTRPLEIGKVENLQSISGPNLAPVLLGPKGEVLLSRVLVLGGHPQTKVPVYLLSDPDLLNNQILSDPVRVSAALDLIDGVTPQPEGKTHAKYVFNLTFNGLSFDRDLLHAISQPPFIAVPLSLLILAVGLMWSSFSRFGPPKDVAVEAPLGRGVRILADNAARLMAMTLKETKLGPAYAQLMRDRVLKARGYRLINANQSPDELAERIGQTHGTTHSYLDLKAKAEHIATVHQLVDLTLQLHAWKTEIDHAHI